MGTPAERIDREIGVLRAEIGIGDVEQLPREVRDYIDAIEELCRDTAERVDRTDRDRSSSSSAAGVKAQPGGSRRGDLPPGSQRYRIAQHLCSLNLLSDEGQIADEIAVATGIPLNSVSTRMSELLRDGWIAEQGEGVAGKTRYAATDKARQHFEQLAAENAARAAKSPW